MVRLMVLVLDVEAKRKICGRARKKNRLLISTVVY
jgi:hypothetical protein